MSTPDLKLFDLGQIFVTSEALTYSPKFRRLALYRHQRGDWGNVSSFGADKNKLALTTFGRISSYYLYQGIPVSVMTDLGLKLTIVRTEP